VEFRASVSIPDRRGIVDGTPHREFLSVHIASKTRNPTHNHVIPYGIDREAAFLNMRERLEPDSPLRSRATRQKPSQDQQPWQTGLAGWRHETAWRTTVKDPPLKGVALE